MRCHKIKTCLGYSKNRKAACVKNMLRTRQESKADKAPVTKDLEAKAKNLDFIPNATEYFKAEGQSNLIYAMLPLGMAGDRNDSRRAPKRSPQYCLKEMTET